MVRDFKDPLSEELFEVTMRYIVKQLEPCSWRFVDIPGDFVLTTSYGFFEHHNHKDKRHLFACKDCMLVLQNLFKSNPEGKKSSLWKYSLKEEILPEHKVFQDLKCRGFIIPPLYRLWYQKQVSSQFNYRLKDVEQNVMYGFTKQYGGWNRFCSILDEKATLIIEEDAKYWDKQTRFKDICYDIRKRLNIDSDPVIRDKAIRILFNNKYDEAHTLFLTPTGEVYQKFIGQNSGSEDTTTDNTIVHLFIIIYYYLAKHYDLYGEVMPYHTLHHVMNDVIFSDDVVRKYTVLTQQYYDRNLMPQIYSKFGARLLIDDPEKHQEFKSMEGCKFLGYTAKWVGDHWGWTFDFSRVVAAFMYPAKKTLKYSVRELAEKYITLLGLLRYMDEFEIIAPFVRNYLKTNGLDHLLYRCDQQVRCREYVNHENWMVDGLNQYE